MTDVFVERRLPEVLTEAGIYEIAVASAPCLAIHRVDWRASMLSADGAELFCHFHAADAESVRLAMRQAGAPPGNAWPCTFQDAPDVEPADLANVGAIVLHEFDEPARFGAREMQETVATGCFLIHRVKLLRSYLSLDGRRMIGLYQTPDVESLRQAQRKAGLPPERIVGVRRYAP